jgi:hypothetical protein
VPDDMDARLVVLGSDHPYSKDPGCPAEVAAKAIFELRGNSPRLFRNTIVFLAVDQTRLQDLDEAVRRYLAWESILAEKEKLNLDPHQVKQAETQQKSADGAVTARVPESYQWLLVPTQTTPQALIQWQAFRLTGTDALAIRASKKLRNDELLVTSLAGTRLRMELDRVPLWRGDHVAIKQLTEDFARYLYLPRLAEPAVLLGAIGAGLNLLSWELETFAFADSFDEGAQRFRGLRCGERAPRSVDTAGILVKPDVARRQLEAEMPATASAASGSTSSSETAAPGSCSAATVPGAGPVWTVGPALRPKRFHGAVVLDSTRVGRDAGKIAEEVIAHLAGLPGSNVKVTLEIEAEVPSGAPDNVVRTVTENSRTLKFTSHGFEEE